MITNRSPMDFETTPNFSFDVIYTAANGDKFTETVNLQLSNSNADSGDHLINVVYRHKLSQVTLLLSSTRL